MDYAIVALPKRRAILVRAGFLDFEDLAAIMIGFQLALLIAAGR